LQSLGSQIVKIAESECQNLYYAIVNLVWTLPHHATFYNLKQELKSKKYLITIKVNKLKSKHLTWIYSCPKDKRKILNLRDIIYGLPPWPNFNKCDVIFVDPLKKQDSLVLLFAQWTPPVPFFPRQIESDPEMYLKKNTSKCLSAHIFGPLWLIFKSAPSKHNFTLFVNILFS